MYLDLSKTILSIFKFNFITFQRNNKRNQRQINKNEDLESFIGSILLNSKSKLYWIYRM